MDRVDQSIEILRATRDGNDLNPGQLALVQAAVNNRLTEEGVKVFEALYQQVHTAQYQAPWLCGVQHLTQDAAGYVYWRGVEVEHYSYQDNYEAKKAAAEKLGATCRALEAKGFPVTLRTVLAEEFLEAPADTPWLQAMQRFYAFFEKDGIVRGIFWRNNTADGVVLIEVRDGRVIRQHAPEAYDAFHISQDSGWRSLGARGYAAIAWTLTQLGLSPALLHEACA